MQNEIETTVVPGIADEKVAENKGEFARRYCVSKRTCDGWIARGMPHLKLSPRMVRVPVAEATKWVRENYFVQRRAKN